MNYRHVIQGVSALLQNGNFMGFIRGRIYTGPLKGFCIPGLNCYSCPGALFACPIGTLQNALSNSLYQLPVYILGMLLMFGGLLGRMVCGFLCPFGFVQDLLHKLPGKKIKKGRWSRTLSYGKYLVLLCLVLIPSLLYINRAGSWPAFCKYLCPSGTLFGGIPLVGMNESLQALVSTLFSVKVLILALVIIAAVLVYRPFCRFLCPLGAIYSLFNKVSLFGVAYDTSRCTSCGACKAACRSDIERPGDRECISCGDCAGACPQGIVAYKSPKKAKSSEKREEQ